MKTQSRDTPTLSTEKRARAAAQAKRPPSCHQRHTPSCARSLPVGGSRSSSSFRSPSRSPAPCSARRCERPCQTVRQFREFSHGLAFLNVMNVVMPSSTARNTVMRYAGKMMLSSTPGIVPAKVAGSNSAARFKSISRLSGMVGCRCGSK